MSKEEKAGLLGRRQFIIDRLIMGSAFALAASSIRDSDAYPSEKSTELISNLIPDLVRLRDFGLPKANEDLITSEITDGTTTYKLIQTKNPNTKNLSPLRIQVIKDSTQNLYFFYKDRIIRYTQNLANPVLNKQTGPTYLTNAEITEFSNDLKKSLDSYLEQNRQNRIG